MIRGKVMHTGPNACEDIWLCQLPIASDEKDTLLWEGNRSGSFSIKLACEIFTGIDIQETDRIWPLIWKWRGSQRIRIFLWLLVHTRLLTNELKTSRNMGRNSYCPRCESSVETTLHVLRDCLVIRNIWVDLIPQNCLEGFFFINDSEWLKFNLTYGDLTPTIIGVLV